MDFEKNEVNLAAEAGAVREELPEEQGPSAGVAREEASAGAASGDHNFRRHRSQHKSGSGMGAEQELESLRIEYQNLFERSNKLDNKVYITVTFLGFMFVFITSLFGSIPELKMNGSAVHDILSVLYIIACIAVSVTYVWNLVYYMRLLAPEHIVRLDPNKIAEQKLDSGTIEEAEYKLIVLYRAIINEDLDKLHLRCDRFVFGLRLVIVTLVLSFVLYGLQMILKVMG